MDNKARVALLSGERAREDRVTGAFTITNPNDHAVQVTVIVAGMLNDAQLPDMRGVPALFVARRARELSRQLGGGVVTIVGIPDRRRYGKLRRIMELWSVDASQDDPFRGEIGVPPFPWAVRLQLPV